MGSESESFVKAGEQILRVGGWRQTNIFRVLDLSKKQVNKLDDRLSNKMGAATQDYESRTI